ncbi:MAG: hypothetical protein ACYS0D_01815 [Planctomycetota bacterium]|jgi:hypothetical protein
MNTERLIGSTAIRVSTVIFAVLCVVLFLSRGRFPESSGLLLVLAIVSGILACLAFIHSFRAVYDAWMRFAKVLHTIVVAVLFGACYLAVVPLFFLMVWPSDPLRLRKGSKPATFWIRRREFDPSSLNRMG